MAYSITSIQIYTNRQHSLPVHATEYMVPNYYKIIGVSKLQNRWFCVAFLFKMMTQRVNNFTIWTWLPKSFAWPPVFTGSVTCWHIHGISSKNEQLICHMRPNLHYQQVSPMFLYYKCMIYTIPTDVIDDVNTPISCFNSTDIDGIEGSSSYSLKYIARCSTISCENIPPSIFWGDEDFKEHIPVNRLSVILPVGSTLYYKQTHQPRFEFVTQNTIATWIPWS